MAVGKAVLPSHKDGSWGLYSDAWIPSLPPTSRRWRRLPSDPQSARVAPHAVGHRLPSHISKTVLSTVRDGGACLRETWSESKCLPCQKLCSKLIVRQVPVQAGRCAPQVLADGPSRLSDSHYHLVDRCPHRDGTGRLSMQSLHSQIPRGLPSLQFS